MLSYSSGRGSLSMLYSIGGGSLTVCLSHAGAYFPWYISLMKAILLSHTPLAESHIPCYTPPVKAHFLYYTPIVKAYFLCYTQVADANSTRVYSGGWAFFPVLYCTGLRLPSQVRLYNERICLTAVDASTLRTGSSSSSSSPTPNRTPPLVSIRIFFFPHPTSPALMSNSS